MSRGYTMRGVLGVAHEATELAKSYLLWLDPASRVHDVQENVRVTRMADAIVRGGWEEADS